MGMGCASSNDPAQEKRQMGAGGRKASAENGESRKNHQDYSAEVKTNNHRRSRSNEYPQNLATQAWPGSKGEPLNQNPAGVNRRGAPPKKIQAPRIMLGEL